MKNRVELFFFRHGQTDWNKKELVQGNTDVPLNETGRVQAQQIVADIKNLGLDFIVASTLKRASETAEIVAGDLPILYSDALREINFGEAEGCTGEEVKDKFLDILSLIDDPLSKEFMTAKIPGGESRSEVIERATTYLKAILKEHSEAKKVGVATHGGLIHNMLLHCTKTLPTQKIGNCEIVKMNYLREEDIFTL